MRSAVVSVKLADAEFGLDLEVPVDVEAGRLAPVLAGVLAGEAGLAAPTVAYRLTAYPPGRMLDPAETLASAGVWDGAWLVLVPET